MTINYSRSPILSYYELSEEQQIENIELQDDSFVLLNDEALPLSMFMRADSNFTHGIYGLTYFSCYTITLNKSNDEAVVAYKVF